MFISLLLTGCARHQEPPIWQQIKIGDLAPKDPNRPTWILDTTNLDIYVFHIPQDKLKAIRGLWDGLNPRPIRYANYTAFRANAFRAAQANIQKWDWVLGSLAEAGARLAGISTVWLQGDLPHDLKIWTLPLLTRITHTPWQGPTQQVGIGPGVLALRLRADPMAASGPIRQLVAYPVFTPGPPGPIDQLAQVAKKREVEFIGAGFAVPISEGDVVVLGPEEYCGDQSTLAGIFFREQQPGFVVGPGGKKLVQTVPVVRIYAIVCTRISSSDR